MSEVSEPTSGPRCFALQSFVLKVLWILEVSIIKKLVSFLTTISLVLLRESL